jgi:hypothetical protein
MAIALTRTGDRIVRGEKGALRNERTVIGWAGGEWDVI